MSKHILLEKRVPIEINNPSIMLVEDKCIKCGLCKRICKDYITVQEHYDLALTNDEAICIHCGQCAAVCPVDAIVEKPEQSKLKEAIQDSEKIVVFSTAPAVRIALGDAFGLEAGTFVEGKMVSLLKKLGANYVLDVNFGADLTIMEEASELIDRITTGSKPLPQFTSCCPSWVEFAETFYPEILPQISSTKSPIGMQGTTIKTYFAKKMGIDPARIVNVTIAPCTAKKAEIRRDEMNAAGKYHGMENMRDNDYVLTTKELADWAKSEEIEFVALEESNFDSIMGEASGAGQPKHKRPQVAPVREKRMESLYQRDRQLPKRASYENEEIQALYKEFLGAPLSELAEELLHTHYTDRSEMLGNVVNDSEEKVG